MCYGTLILKVICLLFDCLLVGDGDLFEFIVFVLGWLFCSHYILGAV